MKILCWMILVVKQVFIASISKSHLFLLSVIVLFVVLLTACSTDNNNIIQFSGATMGTTYNVTLVSPPQDIISLRLQREVDELLASLNQQMSTYLDDSEIIQFNRLATNTWFTVSPEFFEVVALSQTISELSAGRFDITIGPLVELWGFGKNWTQLAKHSVPDKTAIDEAKNRVGWHYLEMDPEQGAIRKKVPLWLDVSAVAKGYAVDQLAERFMAQGVEHFLVEIGGEMRVRGLNRQHKPWRVGIESPSLLQRQAKQLVLLSNMAIATSGDYRNYFEENGERYSHTLDPSTGYPVKHRIASVTVIAQTSAEADALATALNVMGATAAMELADQQQLAVFFIFYDNDASEQYRIEYTEAFEQFLPPTTATLQLGSE